MFDFRWYLLLCCWYWISCANIQAISGGPEDKTPPMLVECNSSPNFKTNFKEREIVLSFNEWIRMDNPTANISISPPTEFPPEYKLKGKGLIIRFDKREILKENTTYTIQFGESIKDITAGNIQRSLRYIFSTGDYLDSLNIQGKVIDAFTKKPKEKILVSLYKLLDDTAFQKIKPYYFCWSDTAGHFSMQNLSSGIYKLYALEDKNQNYFYDQLNEAFAFYPDTIQLYDTLIQKFQLNISVRLTPVVIKEKQIHPGEIKIFFNEKPSFVKLNCDSSANIKLLNLEDSVLIWNYGNLEANCIFAYENKKDTFKIQAVEKKLSDSIKSLRLLQPIIKPGDQPAFVMNYPIINIIKDSIRSIDSTSMVTGIKMDSLDPRTFYLVGKFSDNKQNRVVIAENSITGLHETTNRRDTFTFRYLDKISLSRLKINLDSLQMGLPYIFQLLNGEAVSEEFHFNATETNKKLFFQNLFPGKYIKYMIHTVLNLRMENGKYRYVQCVRSELSLIEMYQLNSVFFCSLQPLLIIAIELLSHIM